MASTEPIIGREIVREQLSLDLDQRFVGEYDPTLVYVDGEWHYPMTPGTTLCDEEIPDPVTAVESSDFTGPSTMCCSECLLPVGGMNKRDIRRKIVGLLEGGETNTAGFSKATLVKILEAVEDNKRRDDEIPEFGDRLDGAVSTMAGEADELAARRPHPDAHLYDVEEGLRFRAGQLNEWLQENYYG